MVANNSNGSGKLLETLRTVVYSNTLDGPILYIQLRYKRHPVCFTLRGVVV
jgi:hypothetical protein